MMDADQGPQVQAADSLRTAALSLFISLGGSSLLPLAASCLEFSKGVKAWLGRRM